MIKGDLIIQVDKRDYPDGVLTVKAYSPVPGLAVHRQAAYRSTKWRRWIISHVDSGLRLNEGYFKRLGDAFLACKLIADILPWTSSADEIKESTSKHKISLVKAIIHYAQDGLGEAEISSKVMEREFDNANR